MPEDYAPRARDAGGYRRRSRSPPPPYSRLPGSNDLRPKDGEYYRSREDALSPSRSLNYDDDGEYHEGGGDNDGDRGRSDRGGGDRYGGARRGDWGRHGGGGGGGGGGRHYNDDDDYRARGRGTSPSGRHNGGYKEGQSSRRHNDAPAPAPGGKIIVLQGIPEDATERDVLYGLNLVTRDPNTSTDQIKIVRFRYDSAGRRLAVVEFKRRADAESFMEQYHPDISFPLEHTRGPNSEYITMDIFFERSRSDMDESRRDDEDWDCLKCGAVNFSYRAVCFKCKTERPDDASYGYSYGAPSSGPLLTGETDEDPQQMPSQYLVIRDLEASVTEEVLARGVMKLFREETTKAPTGTHKLKSTAPGSNTANLGAKPGSLRRVFLIRNRKSNESWRYGFAEFATVEDAKGAVAKFRNSPRFTIASRAVVVSFIHTGVFIPAFEVGPDEDPRFSFQPIYNPTIRLKYWDERVYPSIHVVSVEPTSEPQGADTSTDRKDGGAIENPLTRQANLLKKFRKKEPAPGEKGIAMMPQMQMWTKKAAELHGKKLAAAEGGLDSAGFEGDDDDQEPDGPLNPHWADQHLSYADWDRMICLLCDWEVPSQETINNRGHGPYTREDLLISHEVIVHNHFKDPETKEKAFAKLASLGKGPRSIARRTPRLKHDAPPVYTSYADFDALYCHLCHRTFKHAETIWRHEQESELHKRMLSDAQAKERAVAELAAKGKVPLTMVPDKKLRREEQRTQQYRDRAMERRQAFLQPNKPGGQLSKQMLAGIGASVPTVGGEKRKEQQLQQHADEEAAAAKKSKGAGMLAKMGWTTGAGLGAEGMGRTQAIATEAYAPGVGLGAEGGKLGDASEEAARRTKGQFSDFVEKTRDKARERFEKLQE
ncbi:hypothetical protein B0H65DRAFT_28477 [Neurospora tetraspora]|uniref:RNA-binding protein n=1 Tax=Neurospora tetraspora TaxID=94610 RepID=A0AAE0JNP5_9PEZI|nr:hypothetical protein B0H65DRAFT_28477 [Neurospora tetraspora]